MSVNFPKATDKTAETDSSHTVHKKMVKLSQQIVKLVIFKQ